MNSPTVTSARCTWPIGPRGCSETATLRTSRRTRAGESTFPIRRIAVSGNFKEHNARYAAFITELHRRIAASGADVAFHKGSSLVGYVANLVLTGWIAAMIVLALVLLWATGWVMVAVLKLGIIAFFLPTLFRFIVRARPRAYEALAIPADALPRTD